LVTIIITDTQTEDTRQNKYILTEGWGYIEERNERERERELDL